jgi:hypothetical protein
VIVWHVVLTRMESKDGVRAASRQWISAQRSPHRTSSFHHIRRSNSGCVSHFRTYVLPLVLRAYCSPSGFSVPGISRPLPLVPGSPGLPGRALLRRVLWVRCPSFGIGDLSAYPSQGGAPFNGAGAYFKEVTLGQWRKGHAPGAATWQAVGSGACGQKFGFC